MAQAAKRISTTSLNWQKITESLTSQHAAELTRLKGQNSQFSGIVNQLPGDLPKIDFAALKKQLPAQASIIDSLQKQYEAISIPYENIPEEYNKEINDWVKFNEARQKTQAEKATKDKWAKAPPVAQFTRQHFAEYFPKLYENYDIRVENRIPDPASIGFNDYPLLEERFGNYRILRRPDKEDAH